MLKLMGIGIGCEDLNDYSHSAMKSKPDILCLSQVSAITVNRQQLLINIAWGPHGVLGKSNLKKQYLQMMDQ